MPGPVRIRLVARSRPVPDGSGGFTRVSVTVPGVFPSLANARAASARLLARGLQAAVTARGRLDVVGEQADVEALFNVNLTPRALLPQQEPFFSGRTDYFVPDRELELPIELRDTIEFAYVPTPPLLYEMTPAPPAVGFYHLRLDNVAAELNATHCHTRGWTGAGIRVAMTDSGFANHPYFIQGGFDIVRIQEPNGADPSVDSMGHGTGVSANLCAVAPDATLIGVKIHKGGGAALETALEQNPHIISASFGWDIDLQSKAQLKMADPNMYKELEEIEVLINNAVSDGVVVIFAAGNGEKSFPASMYSVIGAGGVTINANHPDEASSFASSYLSSLYAGRRVPDFCGIVGEYANAEPMLGHIALPVPNGSDYEGTNLPAAVSDRGWGIFSGTSSAAPQIAGIAALVLQAAAVVGKTLTPAQLRNVLASNCRDITQGLSRNGESAGSGVDDATGSGLVDAFEACISIAGRS